MTAAAASESALTRILRDALDASPGALGTALAAPDGETVDLVARDRDALRLVTAHFAVVMAQVRSALHTFHFGDPLEVIIVHGAGAIVVHVVSDGYFALLALAPDAPLGAAQRAISLAATALQAEIA